MYCIVPNFQGKEFQGFAVNFTETNAINVPRCVHNYVENVRVLNFQGWKYIDPRKM